MNQARRSLCWWLGFISAMGVLVLTSADVSVAELRVFVAGGNVPPVGQPSEAFVATIRVSDNTVIRITPLPSPMVAGHSVKVHPNRIKAYVTGSGGALAVVNPSDLSVIRTIPMAESSAYGLAFTPDGTQALVCTIEPTVRRINALTDTAIDPAIPVHGPPLDIVVNASGTRAYVGCCQAGYIDVIDLTLPVPAVTGSINLGSNNLQVLALSPDQSLLYVTDATALGPNQVRVFQTGSLVEVTPPSYNPAGRWMYPRSISLAPDNTLAYIGNRNGPPNENAILAMRLSDGTIAWRIQDPDTDPDPSINTGTANPRTSVLTPDGATLYVTLHGRNAVAAIRTADHTYSYLTVGMAPVGCTIADLYESSAVPGTTTAGFWLLVLVLAGSGLFMLSKRTFAARH